ncbi:MAG: hypothetical protein HDR01_07740 [Lachnospiraceae bacterium]|nr:hypothetical protein [Lachnospiraceae bacterium]
MDKYEYRIRAEEINALIDKKKFTEAVKIADTIDWRRVKSVMMLCKISELYKINRRYEDSKDILLLAYDRNPGSRKIVYSLCELAIKLEETVQAVEYYKEFVQIAPRDTGKFILQYRLYEAQDVSLEERIAVLEEYKKRDYREKWAYELAYLYHRIGLATRCVEECDELILWFGEGKYVIKAMELKMLHCPLTASQQEKYDRRFQPQEPVVEEKEETEPEEEKDSTLPIEIKAVEPSNAPTTKIPSKNLEENLKEETEEKESEEPENDGCDQPAEEEPEAIQEELAEEEQAQESEEVPTAQPNDDLDIKVKTIDVDNEYSTINLQQELAKSLAKFMAEEDMGASDATMAMPFATLAEAATSDTIMGAITDDSIKNAIIAPLLQDTGELTPITEEDLLASMEENQEKESQERESREEEEKKPSIEDILTAETIQIPTPVQKAPISVPIQVPEEDKPDEITEQFVKALEEEEVPVLLAEQKRTETEPAELMQPNPVEEAVQLNHPERIEEPVQPNQPEPAEELVQPNQSERIEEPVQLNQPEPIEEAVQSNQPERIEESIQLNQPEPVEEAVQSNQSEQIEEPLQLNQPEPVEEAVQPNQPKQIEKPLQLNQPEPIEEAVQSNQSERIEESIQANQPKLVEEPLQLNQPEPVEEAVQPNEPEQIEEPVQSNQPERIEEPLQPNQPEPVEEAVQSNQPEQIEEPVQPNEPKLVEEPLQLNQPEPVEEAVQPNQPKPVEEAVQLNQPEQIEKPLQLNQPEQIEEPVQSNQPERIEESVQPNEPKLVEEPLQLNQPEQIEKPVQPNQLKQIEEPVQPNEPEQIEEPVQLNQPEQIEEPVQLNQPKQIEEIEKPVQNNQSESIEKLVQTIPSEPIAPEQASVQNTEQAGSADAPTIDAHSEYSESEEQQDDGQITGQLSLEDIMAEWEETKRANEERRIQEMRERVIQQTGPMFSNFDAMARASVQADLDLISPAEDVFNHNHLDEVQEQKERVQALKEPVEEEITEADEIEEKVPQKAEQTSSVTFDTAEIFGLEEKLLDVLNSPEIREEPVPVEPIAIDSSFFEEAKEDAAERKIVAAEIVEEPVPITETPSEIPTLAPTTARVSESPLESMTPAPMAEATPERPMGSPIPAPEAEITPERPMGSPIPTSTGSTVLESPLEIPIPEEPKPAPDIFLGKPVDLKATNAIQTFVPKDESTVRSLTKEEKGRFAPFAPNKEEQRKVARALDTMGLSAATGNMLITGEHGTGTLQAAQNVVAQLKEKDPTFSGQLAKITGTLLAEKNIGATLENLENSALLIEQAGDLPADALGNLLFHLDRLRDRRVFVILEDTKKEIERLTLLYPDLAVKFNARIDIQALDNDGLVNYAREYAKEQEYAIDDMGILALYTKISDMQTIEHAVTVAEVKEMVDKAIVRAGRKNMSHFMDIILAKRYDGDDMIILREKDFLN